MCDSIFLMNLSQSTGFFAHVSYDYEVYLRWNIFEKYM